MRGAAPREGSAAVAERTKPSPSLAAFVSERTRMVEEALDAALPPAGALPSPLHEAVRHSLFAGGKRLRPLILIASAEAVGGRASAVLPAACAVELIHTYSLIHDDLPSMDDSPTRRGRPTCHVVFGEALAVLAGDALHALAFELLAATGEPAGAERALWSVREIATAIGTRGMVGGQALDLQGEGRPELARHGNWPAEPGDGVYLIHSWKTAALLRACVRCGAILAGAAEARLASLTAYGEQLGLAFQIVDDVLDETGDTGHLGKQTGQDAARQKLTFPAVFGIERSREMAALHTQRAIEALKRWGSEADLLREIAQRLLVREA